MSRSLLAFQRTLAALACAAPLVTPTLAHADTCSGLQLNTLTPGVAGTNPNAVAVGDFDRDGRMDVATVNSGSNDVTILLGNGSGGYSGGSTVALGATNPVDIAAGDIDQDGILDLVVAFGSGAQAQVLKGEPSMPAPLGAPGTFDNAAAPFALNAIPSRIYLGEFTSDGDLDLVVLAETARRVLLYGGASGTTFNLGALSNLDLTQPPFSPVGEQPSGAALLDFDRNGRLDLAVAMRNQNKVWILFGNGAGGLGTGPSAGVGAGAGPRDVATGDVNRDGWLDLVTANSGTSDVSVLLNMTGSSLSPQTPATVGGVPIRVALVDLNHDGLLDLAAVDDSGTPRVAALPGRTTGPAWFDPGTASGVGASPRGLAVGRFTADGRADLVTALSVPSQVVVVENRSGTPCVLASFAGAPRSYAAGNGPLASAAADFDEDGREDLVVATNTQLRILRNVNGGLTESLLIGPISPNVRAVAVADMNVDGNVDVVLAKGQPGVGQVQVYLGDGMGGLAAGASLFAGVNTAALVIADFTGEGAPDVVAASEDTGQLFFFKGNGGGGLAAGVAMLVGPSPRAIVAADFNADLKLDLAVAQFGSNNVLLLAGNGDGTFVAGPVLAVGAGPQAIAVGDLTGDGKPDLVTADNGSSQVSVLIHNGAGGFLAAVPYPVGAPPTAVALVQLEGDPRPDIAVTTAAGSGAQTLSVLRNNGSGAFPAPPTPYPVRQSPQAITPIDLDSDGLPDLAVPCRSADAVVILIQRPPVLATAPDTDVGDAPRAAASGDFDGDGDLDLAVANSGGNSLSLLNGDGVGGLSLSATFPVAGAEAVVAGDFNRDGKLDLAVSAPGEAPPAIAVFLGVGGGAFAPEPLVSLGAGAVPDDLVTGDFDRDGDLDLAVCDQGASNVVVILRNSGGSFTLVSSIGAGTKPTAIVTADFDRDGDLDLAVAYDDSNDVQILDNQTPGFASTQTLTLAGDMSPVSLAAADFDANGSIDLAAASFDADRIHVFRNVPGTGFVAAGTPLDAPHILQSLTAADVNRDGRPDLVALATGVSVFRGTGGMGFDPPQTVVARHNPVAAVVGDFDRDGRPDVVAVNEGSDDVSMLRSNSCLPQRLEVSLQPAGCAAGAPPYVRETAATVYDDGGNVATCAAGTVTPAISPGTGDPGALLAGPGAAGAAFASGVASFAGANFLTIDKPGRRYSLQLTAPTLPPVHTRSFTLGPEPQILGPNSVCPSSSGTWQMEGTPDFYDSYAWSLSPPGPPPYDVSPFAYTASVVLPNPPLTGSRMLSVTARVDQCVVSPTPRDIFFGALASVTLQITGASSVCVDCIGGSAKAIETGGGTITARQWGFRTVSLGPITDIPGENGETYVLRGTSFPGPGTYFVVVRSTPTCGPVTTSTEWMVTVSASVPSGEVRNLAASSRGTAASGQNQLRWVNTTGVAEEILIRWDEAPVGTTSCVSPPNVNAPFDGEQPIPTPTPSAMSGHLHSGLLLNTAYCYSVFVKVSGAYSPGRTVKARPFDSTAGPVKWAYATGGTAVAPPTVSGPAILAMSNDRTVHALTRTTTGGDWPAGWVPAELIGVAHSRSPVVSFTTLLSGATVLFAADDAPSGFLHAIDATTGGPAWAAPQPQGLSMTGAPGAIFTQFFGIRDALFVGTRGLSVDNALRALSVTDGSLLDVYAPSASPGPIGPILGSPAIDYATRRIYFASQKRGAGHTLFCLEIGAGSPVFTFKWSRDLGSISGSPVLKGGRVIVGTDAGTVYSIEALDGLLANDHTFNSPDGPVKGFLFPDRRNDDLFFATNTTVWSISDDAASMTVNWSFTQGGFNPSMVLHWPTTNRLYVGSKNGELYQLDFTNATPVLPPIPTLQVLGGGEGQVGAPSLDIGFMPRLLIVGSEPGVVYGVQVPFP